uniref:TM2 domain-containing protein n=1 Tax=Pyrodinium bahamense TaxID=73915 RepID=A0A7S0ABA0_9DINO|mmetsp:Transcript_30807/g.84967  ORF Transcript_30807/g.84967 Transcript_30807/m.84967 type:complete len:225 (+) Transcript_30807:87-761(+)|eukprot:CAMPEP_0179167550 /NCGR_PEP_ID=MMETSP0796-20121207/82380_1 /TAXON_ID=73915 /ORGANISM="Pyrodinium bahamense, Strain pbaha01" /LENGTH=224 /DNA_ID=CAMNT_0020870249 /DNA_START=82 /DNA_END=756 /DNA_ORIENTATION=+
MVHATSFVLAAVRLLLACGRDTMGLTHVLEEDFECGDFLHLLQQSTNPRHSNFTPPAPLLQANSFVEKAASNGTLMDLMVSEVEYELNFQTSDIPVKNKLILAILELLGLGLCGVDRCYMGQTCIGFLKGLTLGGLTVWAFLDYIAVIITCLSMNPAINAFGLRANFTHGSVIAAFVVVLVCVLLKLCGAGAGYRMRQRFALEPKDAEPAAESKPETAEGLPPQ